MRICVTKKDIAKAQLDKEPDSWASETCPIAQSLKRRGFSECTVGIECLWLNRFIGATKYIIPNAGRRFIASFDNQGSESPITFTIEKAAV